MGKEGKGGFKWEKSFTKKVHYNTWRNTMKVQRIECCGVHCMHYSAGGTEVSGATLRKAYCNLITQTHCYRGFMRRRRHKSIICVDIAVARSCHVRLNLLSSMWLMTIWDHVRKLFNSMLPMYNQPLFWSFSDSNINSLIYLLILYLKKFIKNIKKTKCSDF